jgi:hypothetical protein
MSIMYVPPSADGSRPCRISFSREDGTIIWECGFTAFSSIPEPPAIIRGKYKVTIEWYENDPHGAWADQLERDLGQAIREQGGKE